jgi:hypothetical protein
MSLGTDIKEVLQELGIAVHVIRDGGILSGEYLMMEANSRASNPFLRQFSRYAKLSFDSILREGDIIKFVDQGSYYINTNMIPLELEGDVYWQETGLYQCNVSGELRRPSGEVWDTQTSHKMPVFGVAKSNVYGLLVEVAQSEKLEEENFGQVTSTVKRLFVPSGVGVQVNDRYEPYSGEYYRVSSLDSRVYKGVDVVTIEEDTR